MIFEVYFKNPWKVIIQRESLSSPRWNSGLPVQNNTQAAIDGQRAQFFDDVSDGTHTPYDFWRILWNSWDLKEVGWRNIEYRWIQ